MLNGKPRALAALILVGSVLGISVALLPPQTVQIPTANADDVRAFCLDAVKTVGTFGFHDYEQQTEKMEPLFTYDGWKGMQHAFQASRVFEYTADNFLLQSTEIGENGCIVEATEVVTEGRFPRRLVDSATRKWKIRAEGVRTMVSAHSLKQYPITIAMNLTQGSTGPIRIQNWIE